MAGGKQGGSRRAARPPRRGSRLLSPSVLGHAVGITLCVVAWGYLVYAAIDFGVTARSGVSSAWTMLALSCAGAVACLFVGLMLLARLGSALRLGQAAEPAAAQPPPTPRVKGGKRAAR